MCSDLIIESLSENGINKIEELIGKKINLNEGNVVKEVLNKNLLEEFKLQYGIIYNFDSIMFGEINSLVIDKENIMEARFFNEKMEISLHNKGENLEGNIIYDLNKGNRKFEEEYYIYDLKHIKKIKKIKVKKYIAFDEDNQGYVFYVKPCKLIEEASI